MTIIHYLLAFMTSVGTSILVGGPILGTKSHVVLALATLNLTIIFKLCLLQTSKLNGSATLNH